MASHHQQPHSPRYRGRFAPSPTGPLHFGSLVTAVGSLLEARRHQGSWTLRIDDIDPPREAPGATDAILRTLERFGFQWDGPVVYQSRRLDLYSEALDRLRRSAYAYGCACTRREIANVAVNGPNGLIYPGTCRQGLPPGRRTRAWRVRCDNTSIRFHDRFQGPMDTLLAETIGDFVVRRADGHFAYHLAAAVDDGSDGITHLVRGC
ncbi:MAG: tRNA glutamyl-Q(34) synthetase GluQRS, partial [Aquisalimonadaceae bacterium]